MNALSQLGGSMVAAAVIGGVVLVLCVIVWRIIAGRKTAPPPAAPDLTINIGSLDNQAPPAEGPALELFNQPVRLVALVLAPAGRGGELPPVDRWSEVYDALLPGLDKIVGVHKPLVRRWPNQMSTRGFAHAFFQNAQLPGEGGKGTPWCSVAGVFKIEGQAIMAGLILRTADPSSLGQQVIDSEEKWLGCLRVIGR